MSKIKILFVNLITMQLSKVWLYWKQYEWKKISLTTFHSRIRRGYTLEQAISEKIDKSWIEKKKSWWWMGWHQSKYKPSDEEIQETKEVEKYREEINIIKKESDKAQIRNRLKDDIDIYYLL